MLLYQYILPLKFGEPSRPQHSNARSPATHAGRWLQKRYKVAAELADEVARQAGIGARK